WAPTSCAARIDAEVEAIFSVVGGVDAQAERNPPRATQPIIWPILGMLGSPFVRPMECRERAAEIGQNRVGEIGAVRARAHGVAEKRRRSQHREATLAAD